jgi:hypothetical protein
MIDTVRTALAFAVIPPLAASLLSLLSPLLRELRWRTPKTDEHDMVTQIML